MARIKISISIGPHEKNAIQLLTQDSAGTPEQFSTIVMHSGRDDKLIASPSPPRHHGVKFYRFYLGKFIVDIKADKQSTPKQLVALTNGHESKLKVIKTRRDKGLIELATKIAPQIRQSRPRS